MKTIDDNSIFEVSSNAVFETFDDEVIIINMVSGSYFALDAVALEIWTQLQMGQSVQRIVETTQRNYDGDHAVIGAAIQELVTELESEDLIFRSNKEAADLASPTEISSQSSAAQTRPAFAKPVLTKFTDMQDLLLLDPIHEVDEQGWPHAKPAPTGIETTCNAHVGEAA